MYNISLLSPKTFVLLRDRYALDPFSYTQFLTLFSSFTDICCLSELDSLLLFANYNSDFFYFGLRGFSYSIPRFSVYVPYSFRSRGHCTSSLFFSFSILRFIGISTLELTVHPMNINALSLYGKLGFQTLQSPDHNSLLLSTNIPSNSRIIPFTLSSHTLDNIKRLKAGFLSTL